MPGAAIGIGRGVRRLGQRAMGGLPLLGRGGAVDRRTHERMQEAHLGAELDQARRRRGRCRVAGDPEPLGCAPDQQRVTDGLGGRDEQQQARRRRQRGQPLAEALLDAPGQRRPVTQPEPAGQLGRRTTPRQLQQGQRVAPRLPHDPIAHALVERTGDHGFEQRSRIPVVQPVDHELREPREVPLAARLPAPRAPVRRTRPPGGAPRRPAPAPWRRRATARRRRRRPAVAPRPRRTAGSGRPARPGTDPGRPRHAARTPCRAPRAAGRGAARDDPRTARTADAGPRTRARARTRRPPRARSRSPRRAASGTPATRSCRRPPRRAAPAPRCDPSARSPAAGPAPRSRWADRPAAARDRVSTWPGSSLRTAPAAAQQTRDLPGRDGRRIAGPFPHHETAPTEATNERHRHHHQDRDRALAAAPVDARRDARHPGRHRSWAGPEGRRPLGRDPDAR